MCSRIPEKPLKPNGTLVFRKVVKINILITVSTLLNSFPSSAKISNFPLHAKLTCRQSYAILATGSVIM